MNDNNKSFDELWVEFSTIALLIEDRKIDLEELRRILTVGHWNRFDFSLYQGPQHFFDCVCTDAGYGFGTLAMLAYLTFAMGWDFESIRNAVIKALEYPGARQLSDFREARRRLADCSDILSGV